MRRFVTRMFAAAIVLSTPAFAEAPQRLDETTIAAAIKAGEDNKLRPLTSDCAATAGFGAGLAASLAGGIQPDGAYSVVVSRSAGRIAYMAREAKRLYQKFGADDIPQTMRDNTLVYVTAVPTAPTRASDRISIASPVERVVLKSKVKPEPVAQPQDMDITPVEWSNLMGGKVDGTSAVATFLLTDIREFPEGDFDVVLVTQAGERRCKVGRNDRQRLFGK